uniref:Uncharacterized protein n=1 Tax=Setaria italica TaxID=4555 RepID=K3YXR8_SETIT
MQAAKFASEVGIIVRGHIPILTHWKDYKTKDNEDHLKNYIGKLARQLDIDTTSEPAIVACTDMLKSQQRQGRYRLKKKFFNNERCTTNTSNQGQVKFPQCTGSQSYIAHAHVVRQKYVEGDPTPIDLFKNFHCSKNGYTAPAQVAIMGALRLTAETQETTLKSQTEELQALKRTTNQLHSLISNLLNFSTSQSQ